jgi:hypothetical protein
MPVTIEELDELGPDQVLSGRLSRIKLQLIEE